MGKLQREPLPCSASPITVRTHSPNYNLLTMAEFDAFVEQKVTKL